MIRHGLLFLLLAGCEATLLEGLDEATANDVALAVRRAGVEAEKVAMGRRYAVRVPTSELEQAWAATRAAGLPPPPPTTLPDRLVVGPSEAAERARVSRSARLGELLRALPGVASARVELARDGAAVTLRPVAGARVDTEGARELVVRGSGVDPSKVALSVEAPLPAAVAHPAPARRRPVELAAGVAVAALSLTCLGLVIRLRRR